MQTRLLHQIRWRLAIGYAAVMGLILSLCGFAVYEVIIQAHLGAIDRELESVTGTLHDSIEPNLKQPGHLDPIFRQLLPDICLVKESCPTKIIYGQDHRVPSEHHIFSAVYQGSYYYIRFVDGEGRLIALAGFQPEGLPLTVGQEVWQTLKDQQGNRYHQRSMPLHTPDHRIWGYIQVGRSLKELDSRLAALKWLLGLGLPITVLVVYVSSQWLAGLAMRPMNQSYQQMEQFTSDAAHELRTPLATIQATVESVLRMPHLSELEARDTLKTIKRQNHRLAELIQDLLLLSRLERPTLLTQRVPCCLNDLISDLVEEFTDLVLAANLTLTSSVRVHEPLFVVGDEDQLYRLVSNLIVNAIQYTPKGGQITVVLHRSDDHALIHIQDTGIGIPPSEQTRIFDRFYRMNSDRSRSTGGAGLGLAIAQAIVQAHKGSIQVHSELGKGSTFTIRLPL
ncbi:MAG TPA: two-component system sensor histidine kinase RppB [Coleofasciculaceae cyanobacterium]